MALAIHKLWYLLLISLSCYIVVIIIMTIMQARFLYFPDNNYIATPGSIGLSYEEIQFPSLDGIDLHGWFIPAAREKAVVLFCHGNAGNISHRLESIAIFNELGLSIFIFDYRGYGQSKGKPTEVGTFRDAEAAWTYLTDIRKINSENIIIFGRSLGGAIGSWLAAKQQPKALIIESTFSSLKHLAAGLYPFLPVKLLLTFEYKTERYIRNTTCPVLIIHSRDDEIIPFDHGKTLYNAANEPKRFLEINGSHNDGFLVSRALYIKGLRSFIKRQ